MRLSQRLKRIEQAKAVFYSPEEQAELLKAYIDLETICTGKPPSQEEIEAERESLSKPQIPPTKEELEARYKEVEAIWENACAEIRQERKNENVETEL